MPRTNTFNNPAADLGLALIEKISKNIEDNQKPLTQIKNLLHDREYLFTIGITNDEYCLVALEDARCIVDHWITENKIEFLNFPLFLDTN